MRMGLEVEQKKAVVESGGSGGDAPRSQSRYSTSYVRSSDWSDQLMVGVLEGAVTVARGRKLWEGGGGRDGEGEHNI